MLSSDLVKKPKPAGLLAIEVKSPPMAILALPIALMRDVEPTSAPEKRMASCEY